MPMWWRKLRERLTVAKLRRELELSLDAEGMTVARMEHEEVEYVRVPWDDVLMIVAYLKDCYTVDQVRLEVLTRGSDEWLLITEDDVGFSIFANDLGRYLKLENPEWYAKVSSVPFSREFHTIYRRAE